jgi:DNA-binding response OmpR family regulator
MSGLNDEDRRAELAELGVSTVLAKPCSPRELLDAAHKELTGT